MSVKTTLTLTRNRTGALTFGSGRSIRYELQRLVNFIQGALGGAGDGATSAVIQENATGGSLTITLSSFAAGQVLLINGVPFTALSGSATAGNNEFNVSGNDTADAAALAAAITASTSTGIVNTVTATSATNVVTLTSVGAGAVSNAITVENLGVPATGTFTFTAVDNNDACAVNGVTLTAKTTVVDATVQFAVGASNAATATNFAALINSTATSPLITKHVRALARSNVVHLFAKYGGTGGNAITTTSADGDIVVSGARLTGGVAMEYEGAQATLDATVAGADGGTYRTTINGVDVDATGTNGDDTATAASIAAAINASTNALVLGFVRASSSLGTVTLLAVRGGHQGNAITVAVTGTNYAIDDIVSGHLEGGAPPTTATVTGGLASILGNGGRMSGGANDTAVTYSFGTVTP